jgi:N-methylhydantoinase A
VEIVGLRLGIRRRVGALPDFEERPMTLRGPATTAVRVGDTTLQARLLTAASLARGDGLDGPTLLESYSSTIWVPPGWNASRDAAGNIFLRTLAQ